MVQVAAGRHSIALKSDGTVVAWGDNNWGQVTVPTGLANVVQVAAGSDHSVALKSDGTVVAWGYNQDGRANVPPELSGVVQISVGLDHNIALKSDGMVVAWANNNNSGELNLPEGLSNVVQVAAGTDHSLALKGDGTVVAWGNNNWGQSSVPVGLSGVVQVAAGRHSIALKSDGTVVAWGDNNWGQVTVPTGLANVVQVAAGEDRSVALKDDGTVVLWGHNGQDWWGHGADGRASAPWGGKRAELADFSQIFSGLYHNLAIQRDPDGDGYSSLFEVSALNSNPMRVNDSPAFVLVGDPQNPDEDNRDFDLENDGIGSVAEEYGIATVEVTNLMYARFLNAVAKSDFLYGLYNTFMGADAAGGILRGGSSGSYSYAVKPGFENRPVNFVSVFDAMRYINWLHNGMPSRPIQDASTTENGAYKLLGSNPRDVVRNSAAKFFLPDQDEWHKAAFYDPSPGDGWPTDSYWPYADQTLNGPGGNFSGYPVNVGATSAEASHYGTYDQGGNVWEWTETVALDGKRMRSLGTRPMEADSITREAVWLGFRVGKTASITHGSALVTPALKRIGHETNLGDDTNSRLGAVPYRFSIGTYEVSNAEYAAFLNAVAKTDTLYRLYSVRMGTDPQGGIMRSGQNGRFVYAVKDGFAKKPVNFVSFYSAMRFCNWLHNGARPDGETERGAYRLLGGIPNQTIAIRRSPGARFFLPTENEWYKAAFYDPSPKGRPTASYWAYAVKSDAAITQQINFLNAYNGLTDVDAIAAKSFFGTFGQSGNAAEWTESLSASKLQRRVYGGHYTSIAQDVSTLGKSELDPSTQSANIGFRIAAAKGWQTILPFVPLASQSFPSQPFAVVLPQTTSGLPVVLSVKSGPARVTGSTVRITGLGTVELAANQAGNADYDPAPEVTVSFSVKKAQSITFSPRLEEAFALNKSLTLTATATSKLKVVFASGNPKIMTVSGRTATIKGKGSVEITASQAGDANWSAAVPVKRTINIE